MQANSFPVGWCAGRPEVASRGFTRLQLGLGCQVVLSLFLAGVQFSAILSQARHPSLLDKYVVSILVSTVFQCDGAWWLRLTSSVVSWLHLQAPFPKLINC